MLKFDCQISINRRFLKVGGRQPTEREGEGERDKLARSSVLNCPLTYRHAEGDLVVYFGACRCHSTSGRNNPSYCLTLFVLKLHAPKITSFSKLFILPLIFNISSILWSLNIYGTNCFFIKFALLIISPNPRQEDRILAIKMPQIST